MPPPNPTPFGLLLGELQGLLHPDAFDRVRVLMSSWAGQQINVPAPRRWLIDAAQLAASRMLAQGVPTPVIRERLISMGVSRATAYNVIARTKKTDHAAAR
jgi:hypothetical protein